MVPFMFLVILALARTSMGYPASTIIIPIWPGEQVTQGPIIPTPRQTAQPTYNTAPPSGKCAVSCTKPFEYLADPCNCECFYQCTFVGKPPTHYKCPVGLRWNTRSMACDHVENVQCTADGGQYVVGGGVYTGIMGANNGAGQLGDWNAKLCCDGDGTGTQQVIQGSGSWGTGTRQVPSGSASRQVPVYPRPVQTGNYGTKQVPANYGGTRQVPTDTQQVHMPNYQQQQKEWWSKWKQDNTGTQNIATGTKQVPAGSGSWSGSYTGGSSGSTGLKGVCSANKDGIMSHPSDCKKFVSCVGGVGFERVCPAGLTFDAVSGNCEWPEKASCQRGGAIIHNGIGGGGGSSAGGGGGWSGGGGSSSATQQVVKTGQTNWAGQSSISWTGQSHLGVGIQTGQKRVLKGVCLESSDGIMSHPNDCTKFVGCTGGIGFEFLCPGGLRFDSIKGVCEWPESAICGKGGVYVKWSVGGGSSASSTATKQTGGSSWSSSSTATGQSVISTGNKKSTVWGGQSSVGISLGVATGKPVLKGVCPFKKDGIKPHNSDCRKFIACTGGDGFEFLCPGGLHFDAPKGICNWPEQSKCQLGAGYVAIGTSGSASSSWSSQGGGTRQTGGTWSQGSATKTVIAQKPQLPQPKITPNTATQQIITASKTATKQVITAPSTATKQVITASNTATKQVVTNVKTSTGQTNIGLAVTGKEGMCPQGFKGSLAHPTICSKFYKCDKEGLAYEHNCPDNLLYDVKSKNCNWPEEVNCLGGGSGGGGGGGASISQATQQVVPPKQSNNAQHIITASTTANKQVITAPNTATKQVITASNTATKQVVTNVKTSTGQTSIGLAVTGKEGICPKGFKGSLAHPTICNKFYKCDKEGLAYEHNCPNNLQYDVKSKNCNWPEEVNCLGGGGGVDGGGGASIIQATQQVVPPKQSNIAQENIQTQNTITIGGSGTKQVISGIKSSATKQVVSGIKSTATQQVVGNTKTGGTKQVINTIKTSSGTRQIVDGTSSGTKQVVGGINVGIQTGKAGVTGVCPAGQIGRYPHATDCTKFLMCANEVGHEFSCPNGLLYDPPTKDCTWPEKANCKPTNINIVGPVTLPPMDRCVGSNCDCPPGMIGVQPFCMPDPNANAVLPTPVVADRCRGEGCKCPTGMIGVEPFCMPDPNLSHGGEVISTDGQNIKGGISYAEFSSNLMVDVILTAYITSTSTGGRISHPTDPVELKLRPHPRGGVNVTVVAPLMDSPRGGPPNCLSPITPCVDLPNYESLSIVFLSDNGEWALELLLGAHGHYVVQLYDGYGKNFTFNLPVVFDHSLFFENGGSGGGADGGVGRWRGEARIPTEYLPPVVTKFNAFYNYGAKDSSSSSDKQPNMVLESLFPATEATKDARAFKFFQPLNMAKIDPENWKGVVPKIWKERAQ